MKDLDITKKYDLSQLNDEQLQAVLDWLKENDNCWGTTFLKNFRTNGKKIHLFYNGNYWNWGNGLENTTNAIELFEEETHLLTAQDFVNASKGLAKIGIGLKELSDNLNNVSKSINDKMSLDSDILSLIEKGKQHGLKIVVTFEKL